MDQEIEELNDTPRPRFDLIEKPSILISPPFKNPVDYEEFSATFELVATFIPNGPLCALRDWPSDSEIVETLADFLRTKCRFALSLVPGDGESKINLRRIVKKVFKLFDANHRNYVAVLKKAKLNAGSKAMHGEYSLIDTRTNVVLIGCEAKETGATHRQCITQLLSLCGNGAMEMRQRGVALDDCVTLGIVFADDGIQFCAVYLMDSSFPMFVNLSPVLHPLHHAEEIAKWMLRFVYGASLALDTLHTATEPIQNLQLRLNTSSHFFKPVQKGYKGATSDREPCQHHSVLLSRLDHIFRIYDRLHKYYTRLNPRPTDWSISFPVGCITVPSQASAFQRGLVAAIQQQEQHQSMNLVLRPCLLFPRVEMTKTSSEALTVWRDFKPPAHLLEPFLASFRSVVTFLNEAGVVHFNLRPSNVLWRSLRDGCVEVMLINFDDALFCNQRIPHEFASAMRKDPRCPLYHMDHIPDPQARVEHNTFYVTQLEQWLACADTVTFDEFIRQYTDSTCGSSCGGKKRTAEVVTNEAESTSHRKTEA